MLQTPETKFEDFRGTINLSQNIYWGCYSSRESMINSKLEEKDTRSTAQDGFA